MFANFLLLEGKQEESLARLLQAAQTASGDAALQEQIGRALLSQRRRREAEERFRRVLAEDPETPSALRRS